MARYTFLYRCPTTGYKVQGYLPEQTSDDENLFVPVDCPVCNQVHLVNPATGGRLPVLAALLLFATGLGGFGLLGWRRKRKAQAVA